MKKKTKSAKLEGTNLPKLVGKWSYVKVFWNSWKDKLPPAYQQIHIILRLDKGYYVVTGEYLDPEHFQYVKFDNHAIPDTYLGTKDGKRLIAWGELEKCDAPKHS